MLNTTTVTFAGNLVADPELRFTPSGKPVAEVRVLVNRRTRNDAGDYVDAEPTAWPCTIWGSAAENVADSLIKGDRVLLARRVETDTWIDRESEDERTKPVVVVEVVEEIATSLTWATATPTKTPRTGGNSNSISASRNGGGAGQ